MTEPSPQQRLKSAYEAGHLFAHMFELRLEDVGFKGEGEHESIPCLLKVMAGDPTAKYTTLYGHEFKTLDFGTASHPERGIVGLPTTALKEGQPVDLYTVHSNVGLLMDSAKPLFVSDRDSYTEVTGANIRFTFYDTAEQLRSLQNIPTGVCRYKMLEGLQGRFNRASLALPHLWQYTSRDFSRINEVTVAAQTKDICGIIVRKEVATLDDGIGRYQKSLKAAKKLKAYLVEHHHIDPALPFLSYELFRLGTDDSNHLNVKTEILDDATVDRIIAGRTPGTMLGNKEPGKGQGNQLGGGA